MNEVTSEDNRAIREMNRFNAHCPEIGEFSVALKLDKAVVTFTPKASKKPVEASGSGTHGLMGAWRSIKGKIDPEKLDGEGEAFIGQKYVAKMILAEK